MRKRSQTPRRQSGVTNIVEFGPTMWITFIIFVFPLLTFGTMGLRYCFVNNAVCYAAEAAAQSNSFLVNADATHYSATNSANNVMTLAASSWNGISLVSVTTNIVIAPLTGGPSSKQNTVLDTTQLKVLSQNVYMVEVIADVNILPLFPLKTNGGVPGLNAPIHTFVSHKKYIESPGRMGT